MTLLDREAMMVAAPRGGSWNLEEPLLTAIRTLPLPSILVLLLLGISAASRASDPAGTKKKLPSYRWSATDVPLDTAAESRLERVKIAACSALRFDSSRKTSLDLTAEYPWADLTGAMTIRLVVRPTRSPRGKTPLVSRWHMKPGGRSFELGLLPTTHAYLDVSGSGNWDSAGRELVGSCQIIPGRAFALAAVFEPSKRLSLHVNGHLSGEITRGIPPRLHGGETPLLLGAQPPGQRWADFDLSLVVVDPRPLSSREIQAWAASLGFTEPPPCPEPVPTTDDGRVDLSLVRVQVLDYCRALQVEGRPCGVFRARALPDAPVHLYATCDVAWIRACMGEDLRKTLTAGERAHWIDHINSYAQENGTYPGGRHSLLHANGMVIGALAVLGGRQPHPVSLYDAFDEVEEIGPWLEEIRWDRQWSASHLFWGGMHCFSLSSRASDRWREAVFRWLDAELNPETGWWRKGVPQSGMSIEVLGGAAHIWPVYQHHGRRFPRPRKVIESILSLQRPDGSWLGFSNYMDMDALYGLAYMHSLAPDHRPGDIATAARLHGNLVREHYPRFLPRAPDAHIVLSVVSTLALLQELLPGEYHDDIRWSDIFSDRRFYRTDLVESLASSWKTGATRNDQTSQ